MQDHSASFSFVYILYSTAVIWQINFIVTSVIDNRLEVHGQGKLLV